MVYLGNWEAWLVEVGTPAENHCQRSNGFRSRLFQILRAMLKKTPSQQILRKHGKRETQRQIKSRSAGPGPQAEKYY